MFVIFMPLQWTSPWEIRAEKACLHAKVQRAPKSGKSPHRMDQIEPQTYSSDIPISPPHFRVQKLKSNTLHIMLMHLAQCKYSVNPTSGCTGRRRSAFWKATGKS